MTEEQEYQYFTSLLPSAMPDNPSQSGWSAQQIKDQYSKAPMYLYNKAKEFEAILNTISGYFSSGQALVALTAIGDEDGNNIKATYLQIENGIVVLTNTSIDLSGYEEGQLFYDKTTNKFYILDDQGNLTIYDHINLDMRNGEGSNAVEQVPDKEVIKQSNNPYIPEAEMQVGAFGAVSSMFGGPHLVTAKRGMAVGGYNYVSGQNGFASGEANTASGRCAATFGGHNYAGGNASFAQGSDNYTDGDNSHIEGNGSKIIKTKIETSSSGSTKDDIRFVISGNLDLAAVNDTTTLTVTAYNARTNHQIHLTGLLWSSSNNTILEVTSQNDTSAVVTALATGNANIQVQYAGDSIYNAAIGWVTIYVATPRPVNDKAGRNCHAEGEEVEVFGQGSHAEGRYTKAYSEICHAEGLGTQAGDIQVVSSSGSTTTYTYKQIYAAHAEGMNTRALGDATHAEGLGTIADRHHSTAVGKYNVPTKTSNALFVVGKGIGNSARSDAFIVKADGDVQVGVMGSNNLSVATKKYVDDLIASVKANEFQVVDSLPATGQEGIIYLFETSSGVYQQYIWEGSDYIDLGSTQIDLSDYYTKTQADNKFVAKITTIAGIDLQDNIGSQELTDALVFASNSDIDALF